MITKIEIKNFQSHKHTVIDFSNGVNVIIGSSDCGKSAIIKAMRWCITNSPAGNSFRSNFASEKEPTSVTYLAGFRRCYYT